MVSALRVEASRHLLFMTSNLEIVDYCPMLSTNHSIDMDAGYFPRNATIERSPSL